MALLPCLKTGGDITHGAQIKTIKSCYLGRHFVDHLVLKKKWIAHSIANLLEKGFYSTLWAFWSLHFEIYCI